MAGVVDSHVAKYLSVQKLRHNSMRDSSAEKGVSVLFEIGRVDRTARKFELT